MPWIEANGVALRYELAGSGPNTIVLVHEMGGTLESWSEVAPKLAQSYRVLTYDTRGAGLSEKVRTPLSIDTMADDVAGLLDALQITGKIAIVGIAVGGAIAIRFAARHAGCTAALIAMGPATGIAPERRASVLAMADSIERDGMRPGSAAAAMEPGYPSALRGDVARFETVRAQRLGNDPASYAAVYRVLANLNMSADFPRVRCPTLVLAGRLDGLRPPALVEPVAHAIPGAKFAVLETAHFMAWQTPDLVVDALSAFLPEACW